MNTFLTKAVKSRKYNYASLKFVYFQGKNDEHNKTEKGQT